ncbi:uncharacterized protein J8A68_003824, partial [[Candida] subhashii]
MTEPSKDFTCGTCSLQFDKAEILKHLSSTRHKSAKITETDESLECEECSDTNIHQLSILRYGLTDMSLLCTACLAKDTEPPTATYNLSNGAFFLKLDQYLKLRDLECMKCSNDENLFVANTPKEQLVSCKDCLGQFDPSIKFISEDSEIFLSELLGIKEVAASKKAGNHGKRKLGRKGARGGKFGKGKGKGRGGKPKKVDEDAEARREHYFESKRTAAELKSGSTVKAIGSAVFGKPGSGGGSGGGKFGKSFSPGKSPGHSGRSTPATSGRSSPSVEANRGFVTKENGTNTPAEGQTQKVNEAPKERSTQKPKAKKAQTSKAENQKIKDGEKDGKKKSSKDSSKQDKKPPKSNDKPKDNKKTQPKTPKNARSKEASPAPNTPNAAPVSDSNELVLPDYITKYHPATKPKLSYPTLNDYYREMSFNVFLEDQLTNESNIIEPQDLMIEWYEDQDKRNNQFKLSVPMDPQLLDRFISEKFKKLKKNPFQVGQAIFLILNDEIPWYGRIAAVEEVSTSKGRRAKKDVIEMVIKLFGWNNQPLPKSVHAQYLKVMPASVPVSRVFNAMATLENTSFIKMLLGNEPMKQIIFKNYLKFSRDTLNDSQKVAIQSVLNNPITVLQGPPGTGKTSTIFEIILQLLDSLHNYPVLHRTEKERDYDRSHPLAPICLHHKVYDAMPIHYQAVLDDLRRGQPNIGQKAYKKFLAKRFEVTRTMVAQAKVIFTTTVVAGSGQLKSIPKCPVVIMDEATQSSEPTTLIPLAVNGVDKFVFVGDQKQLSCFSLIPGLSLSLFERVLLNGSYKSPHMLDTQYRMHPAISEFPRTTFYGGLLKDGITEEARKMEGIPANPVYFWDTQGRAREESVRNLLREDRGYTYTNSGEIGYLLQVLKNLIIEKRIKKENIGVITPYSGQRDLISSILADDDIINPMNEQVQVEVDIDDIKNDSKPVTIHIISGIMIASIDAFQGREKDFLVMSCVRSNQEGTIGFLRDERRLNVALTRAKYGLIMVGD